MTFEFQRRLFEGRRRRNRSAIPAHGKGDHLGYPSEGGLTNWVGRVGCANKANEDLSSTSVHEAGSYQTLRIFLFTVTFTTNADRSIEERNYKGKVPGYTRNKWVSNFIYGWVCLFLSGGLTFYCYYYVSKGKKRLRKWSDFLPDTQEIYF